MLPYNADYLIFLIEIFIIVGIINDNYLFKDIYYLIDKIQSKRVRLFLIGCFGGVLPIPGRVVTLSGILNTYVNKQSRIYNKLGIYSYISSHHYYLWSPLEKTVILPMAVLDITYNGYLSYMWPLILITFLYIFWYIFYIIKEDDIQLSFTTELFTWKGFVAGSLPLILGILVLVKGYPPAIIFSAVTLYYIITNPFSVKKIPKYIKWDLVIVLAVVLIIGTYAKMHLALFEQWLQNSHSVILASVFAFVASWLMGSSGKYAGLAAILISIFGIEYMLWFLTIEFAAYNLSPTHKCVHIGRMYFNTPLKEYFVVIFIWQLLLIIYSFLVTFVF